MRGASDFFSLEEKERINRAVAEAEKHTSGEIVPVVATVSGRYDRAEDIAGLLFGLAALILFWLLFQRVVPGEGDWALGYRLTLGLPWLVLVIVAGFIIGAALASRVAWLRRPLVSEEELRQEVEWAARQAFARFRVGRTVAGTGILIYVSLFERMVYVLGDEPIAAKLDQTTWNEIRDTIIVGIRERRAADAFCQAIARCGELLGKHFPYKAGDINEVGNELRVVK
jgi:putative membrane protein